MTDHTKLRSISSAELEILLAQGLHTAYISRSTTRLVPRDC